MLEARAPVSRRARPEVAQSPAPQEISPLGEELQALSPAQAAAQAVKLGRLDDAFQLYRQAIAGDPRNADLWTELGELNLRQGQSLDAMRAFQKALSLDKGLARAWYQLGKLHQTQGHTEDALQAFQKTTVLAPGTTIANDAARRLSQLNRPAVSADAWGNEGDKAGAVKLFDP